VLPSRAILHLKKRRRRARGSKAIKAKVCVTFVLACSATGFHMLPVAIIGLTAVPL